MELWSTELTELHNKISLLEDLKYHQGWPLLSGELEDVIEYKKRELFAKPLEGEHLQKAPRVQGYCDGIEFSRTSIDKFIGNWLDEIQQVKAQMRDIENVEE